MKTQRARGFTLIELLTALAIMMIIVTASAAVLVAGASMTRNGNQVVESNDNVNAAGEMLASSLRSACLGSLGGVNVANGGVPAAVSCVFGSDAQTNPQTNTVAPMSNLAGNAADELWAVVPDHNAFGETCSLAPGNGGQGTSITADTLTGSLPVQCTNTFTNTDLLEATQLSSLPTGGVTSAILTVSGLTPNVISFNEQAILGFSDSSSGWHKGDFVFRAHIYHFFIAPDPNANNIPALYRQPALPGPDSRGWPFKDDPTQSAQIYDGVEDLQLAYGFDPLGTGNPAAYTFQNQLTCGGGQPACAHSDLRSLRVNLVGHGSLRFTDSDGPSQSMLLRPLNVENHIWLVPPPPDGYRRTIYTRRIELANMTPSLL
jgi:prepilin-type N-terminal cleavage/methylation domain-containing protein